MFGFHEAYLKDINKLRFRYTVINSAIIYYIIQLIIGSLLGQTYVSHNNASKYISVLFMVLFAYWIIDGLCLWKRTIRINKTNRTNRIEFELNKNEIPLLIISKNIFGVYPILLNKKMKFRYMIFPISLQGIMNLAVLTFMMLLSVQFGVFIKGGSGSDYAVVGAFAIVLGVFLGPAIWIGVLSIIVSYLLNIILFIIDFIKCKKEAANSKLDAEISDFNNSERKSLIISLIISILLSILSLASFDMNITLSQFSISKESNDNVIKKVFDKRDIYDFIENPKKYDGYYFEDITFTCFNSRNNSPEGMVSELYDNKAILKGNKTLLKEIHDKYNYLGHENFLISGLMNYSGSNVVFHIDEYEVLGEDDNRVYSSFYRTIEFNKKEQLGDLDVELSKMDLGSNGSFIGINIKNNSHRNILIDAYDLNDGTANLYVESKNDTKVTNILKPNTFYTGEISFPYGIDDRTKKKVSIELNYAYNKSWDGYSENSKPSMDGKVRITVDIENESVELKNITINNHSENDTDTNDTDTKMELEGRELSKEIKGLSLATEKVLLSPFEDPTNVNDLDKNDNILRNEKVDEALDDYDSYLASIKDYRVKSYAKRLRTLLVFYPLTLHYYINNDEEYLEKTKQTIQNFEKEIEVERFEMFKLCYNPSDRIDYVLPEMLGISFKHVDDLRNIEFIRNSYYDVFLNMLDYPNYQTPNPNNALHYDNFIMEKRSLEELYYTAQAGKMSPGKCINNKYVKEFNEYVKNNNQ